MESDTQQANILRKLLTQEVKFIIIVAGFIWGFAGIYYPIKEDIALIKNNHMAHMEGYSKELTRIADEQERQQELIIKLMERIANK